MLRFQRALLLVVLVGTIIVLCWNNLLAITMNDGTEIDDHGGAGQIIDQRQLWKTSRERVVADTSTEKSSNCEVVSDGSTDCESSLDQSGTSGKAKDDKSSGVDLSDASHLLSDKDQLPPTTKHKNAGFRELYPTLLTSKVTSTFGAKRKDSKRPKGIDKSSQKQKLEYPEGFKKYDTSLPDSPYNQDTYALSPAEDRLRGAAESTGVPTSVLEILKAWIPYSQNFNLESTNPVIWQTFREAPGKDAGPYQSWPKLNKPRYSRQFVSDAETETLLAGLPPDLQVLNETYHALPHRIMQLDFLRYLEMYRNGGVYADIDTDCYAPVRDWYAACSSDASEGGKADGRRATQPGLLVGIEFDLLGDNDDDDDDDEKAKQTGKRQVDGAEVGIANYVFAANKGHPVLAKVLASIVEHASTTATHSDTERPNVRTARAGTTLVDVDVDVDDVSRYTGRKLWTDTIVAHIQETVRGFTAHSLQGLHKGKTISDICILPIAAFGSGQYAYKNSPESSTGNGALVKHFFMKSWVGT